MGRPTHPCCAEKERGAVLLTTLLIMSVMAVFAVIMLEDILLSVKRTAQIEIDAQARRYIQGADEYAQIYVDSVFDLSNPALANAQLSAPVDASFPLEGGVLNINIRDSSNCLSLALLSESDGPEIFTVLLETLGWAERDAQEISARLADWSDEDEIPRPQSGGEDFLYLGLQKPHRTANTVFESVYELRALDILGEREFQFLRPFICAHLPSDNADLMRLNINTLTLLQAPLLATAIGGTERLSLAEDLLQNRPPEGWQDLEAFWAAPAFEQESGEDGEGFDRNDTFADVLLGVSPHHIWVDVALSYQNLQRLAALEYRIAGGTVSKTYRYFGDEAHWPRPINLLELEP